MRTLAGRFLPAVWVCILLAGCQVIGSTQEFVTLPDGSSRQACRSGLGSYSLAYSTITVTLEQAVDASGAPTGAPFLSPFDFKRYPDNDHVYCMKFKNNVFAQDYVDVRYSGKGASNANAKTEPNLGRTPNGLLAGVLSKNIDRSGVIFQKLLRAILAVVSGNPEFALGRQGLPADTLELASIEVDPFNASDMARLNNAIKDYGFCVTLGKFTYNSDRLTPAQYCSNPDRALNRAASRYTEVLASQDYLKSRDPGGIYYRPRVEYPVYVYVRDDPGRGTPWTLRKIEQVGLENVSPIISLGVNRRLFAENRIVLAFDNGALLDFCILRGSTAAGAIQIPLDVIYGLVALPGQTIVAEINAANGKQELIAAQEELIVAQNTYIDFLLEKNSTKPDEVDTAGLTTTLATLSGAGFDPNAEAVGSANNTLVSGSVCESLKDSSKSFGGRT